MERRKTDGWMDEWIGRKMDGWMDGCMDGRKKDGRIERKMNG